MIEEGNNQTKGDQYLINGIDQVVDPKDLQNNNHQLVNLSAFETSVFLPCRFSPLKQFQTFYVVSFLYLLENVSSLGTILVYLL